MDLMRIPAFCVLALLSRPGGAAQPDCPPGDWFCEPAPNPASAPPDAAPQGPIQPAERPTPRAPWHPPPPPPPPPDIDLSVPPPPPPIERLRQRPWALRTHLLVPFVGSGAASNYTMGGIGVGGRARPDRAVALDLTVDAFGGNDYLGHRRDELAIDFATTVFFNPRDPVQGFFMAGLGWSRADVSYDKTVLSSAVTQKTHINDTYYYFGMFAGIGLEWRLNSHFSLDFALLGLLRGRTDSKADDNPEFVDPQTKLATNSSGAGLLRLGLNYYF